MNASDPSIGFIGAGVFGTGLALALASTGHRVAAVHSRSASSAHGLARLIAGCQVQSTPQDLADAVDLVFITTPDTVIGQVAGQIRWRSGQGAVHCCGAASTELLQPASEQGSVTGAFHPFQTFACVTGPEDAAGRLAGVTFAVIGNGWLQEYLWGLAIKLGGTPVNIPDDQRALYHSAAVMGCGHLAALLAQVATVWQSMGFTEEQALNSLYPLCRTTLDAVADNGAEAASTGPVVRGDLVTVRSHLEALFQTLPDAVPVYGALAAATLPIAAKRGQGPGPLAAIQELIDHYTGFS